MSMCLFGDISFSKWSYVIWRDVASMFSILLVITVGGD